MLDAAELQRMQDVHDLVCNQRNNAFNECVRIGAELLAAKRRVAELEAQVEELAKRVPKDNEPGPQPGNVEPPCAHTQAWPEPQPFDTSKLAVNGNGEIQAQPGGGHGDASNVVLRVIFVPRSNNRKKK